MIGTLISYRGGDAPGHAGRLFDRLRARLPKHTIRKDVSVVAPGEDFAKAIENAVASSDTVLVVIGRQWIGSTSTGGRLLDDPSDPVRLEIGAALRGGQRVIPVLVGGAGMPPEQALPSEIRGLARRQAVGLRDGSWDQDVEILIGAIESHKAASRRAPAAPLRYRRQAILGAILGVTAAAILVVIALAFTSGPLQNSSDLGHPGIRIHPEITLVGHSDIEQIASVPGERIASLSRSDEVSIWSLATGESESLYKERGVAAIAGIPDGRLALGYWGYIKFLNPDSGNIVETIQLHDPYPDGTDTSIDHLMPLADGMLLSFSSVSVGFCDWNAHKGHVIPGVSSRVAVLSGGRVALLWRNGIGVWNSHDVKAETLLEGQPDSGFGKDLALLPDGRIATTSESGVLGVWNFETGKEKTLRPAAANGAFDNRLFTLPDGRVAEVSNDSIEIWNVSRDRPDSVRTLPSRRNAYMADPLLLGDGRLLLPLEDGGILLWNLQAGEAEAALEGHAKPVKHFLLLDNNRLASAGEDRTIRIWKLPPGGSPAAPSKRAR